jgi:predicted alpha-1,2-mannosidase
MNTKLSILLYIVSVTTLLNHASALAQKEPVDYVDPLIGTSTSRWMLYPGPSMPFGMVKLSPDNQKHCWKAGYDYAIDNIAGFSHIHSWVMGGLLVMPTTGELMVVPGKEENPEQGYRSRINHEKEVAKAGYYSCYLEDYGIKAELTATTRAGFMRFKYDNPDNARILIDLLTPTEYNYSLEWALIRKVSDTELEGFSKQRTYDTFSSLDNEYTIHFVIQFDKPVKSFNGWRSRDIDSAYGAGRNPEVVYDTYEIHGAGDVGAFVGFELEEGETVQVRTGISLVSIDQARLNLDTEMSQFGWNFEKVYQNARRTWNELLSLIQVEGGTADDRTKFYTNFYRSYAARTILSDVNGKYVNQCEQVTQVKNPDSPVYGCDAFWNTFWNLNQLWALATPEVANSWVRSLIELYEQGGWLPKGPTGLEYSSIMVASHEVPLINSVYQKGIRNYDVEKAYEAIKHVQTTPGTAHPCGGLVGNRQLKPYMELGYVPHGEGTGKHHFGTKDEGPVSNTLEYAFDDWNVSQMAKALGKEKDYQHFLRRAENFKNVFDTEVGFVRPKLASGEWYDAKSVFGDQKRSDSWKGTGFIEGNAWQYTWFVPHDVNFIVKALGKEEFNERLNKGFEQSAKVNFNAKGDLFTDYPINHGNQPNMQAAYLFNYSGKPWLTQKWARAIMDDYYGSTPADGWPGDEDQGQMGAWFVMSAIGLFQMDGGGSVKPIYEIGSPLFSKITVQLDGKYYSGNQFVIEAIGNSKENIYIQKAYLNSNKHDKPWFYHSDLVKGGTLRLIMGPKPNENWGADAVIPSMNTLQ